MISIMLTPRQYLEGDSPHPGDNTGVPTPGDDLAMVVPSSGSVSDEYASTSNTNHHAIVATMGARVTDKDDPGVTGSPSLCTMYTDVVQNWGGVRLQRRL